MIKNVAVLCGAVVFSSLAHGIRPQSTQSFTAWVEIGSKNGSPGTRTLFLTADYDNCTLTVTGAHPGDDTTAVVVVPEGTEGSVGEMSAQAPFDSTTEKVGVGAVWPSEEEGVGDLYSGAFNIPKKE